MNKRRRARWLYFCVIIILVGCLSLARCRLVRPAEAFDQPTGVPGTSSDPLLSVSSLRVYLAQLFQTQNQQLDSLQARLDLASQELEKIQSPSGR